MKLKMELPANRNPLMKIMKPICAWLDANNIPHVRVPIHAVPTIANGKITVIIYSHRNGKPYLRPGTHDIATEELTVPLLVEPSAELAGWLAGKVRG